MPLQVGTVVGALLARFLMYRGGAAPTGIGGAMRAGVSQHLAGRYTDGCAEAVIVVSRI